MAYDINLQTRVHTTGTSGTAGLHFDVDPSDSVLNDGFWLPEAIPGLIS